MNPFPCLSYVVCSNLDTSWKLVIFISKLGLAVNEKFSMDHLIILGQITFSILQRYCPVTSVFLFFVFISPSSLSHYDADLLSMPLMWEFWLADPEGISNAQKSLGLGQEEKVRRVR